MSSAVSTSSDIVRPWRAASRLSWAMTVLSMLRVVFIWLAILFVWLYVNPGLLTYATDSCVTWDYCGVDRAVLLPAPFASPKVSAGHDGLTN